MLGNVRRVKFSRTACKFAEVNEIAVHSIHAPRDVDNVLLFLSVVLLQRSNAVAFYVLDLSFEHLHLLLLDFCLAHWWL